MESFLAGLASLGIGGLAWMAYTHPGPYRKLSNTLAVLVLVYLAGFCAWAWGVQAALHGLSAEMLKLPGTAPMSLDPAREAVRQRLLPPTWAAIGLPFAFFLYLGFLQTLPIWMIKDKEFWRGLTDKEKP